MNRSTTSAVSVAFLLGVALLSGSGVAAALHRSHGDPLAGTAPAAAFDRPAPNRYFPLRPGTVSTLRGSDGPERFVETVTVTRRTKAILGVRATVVRDVLRRRGGSLAEKTDDWYAADNAGAVWYFGESTATYDTGGRLRSRAGSWQAGVHGARAGLVMPARPRTTDAFRQEFFAGHAEDQAWIVQSHVHASVPYGRLTGLVRSLEWSRLEPGVVSEKLYAPGIGLVRGRDLAGGHEAFSLVHTG
jgi:hypothetical protein